VAFLCCEKFLLNLLDSLGDSQMSEKLQSRKRGMREVGIVLAAAALVMIPSYIGRIELNRLKIPISIVAVTCFALFLVGVFLLTKGLKD
jgi:Ca2+/Na+ antiporter